MRLSIVVATFGSEEWRRMGEAASRGALEQEAEEVVTVHLSGGTLAEARNQGAALAMGEWLCFLDADDELAPGFVPAMGVVHAALTTTTALLNPAVCFIRGGRRSQVRCTPPIDLRLGNYLVIGTVLPRALFLGVGGFREWPLYEDWCLWQRCWKAGARVVQVPDAVYVATARPQSRNRAPKRLEKLRVHREIVAANFPMGV